MSFRGPRPPPFDISMMRRRKGRAPGSTVAANASLPCSDCRRLTDAGRATRRAGDRAALAGRPLPPPASGPWVTQDLRGHQDLFLAYCDALRLDPFSVSEEELCMVGAYFSLSHTVNSLDSFMSAVQSMWNDAEMLMAGVQCR